MMYSCGLLISDPTVFSSWSEHACKRVYMWDDKKSITSTKTWLWRMSKLAEMWKSLPLCITSASIPTHGGRGWGGASLESVSLLYGGDYGSLSSLASTWGRRKWTARWSVYFTRLYFLEPFTPAVAVRSFPLVPVFIVSESLPGFMSTGSDLGW